VVVVDAVDAIARRALVAWPAEAGNAVGGSGVIPQPERGDAGDGVDKHVAGKQAGSDVLRGGGNAHGVYADHGIATGDKIAAGSVVEEQVQVAFGCVGRAADVENRAGRRIGGDVEIPAARVAE
jgi:hypothetical protein